VDLGFNWVYLGQYRPVEEDVRAIKAVTADDVNALIGELDPGSFTQFTLGPT
jgi:predicted Zn-dependent peptidase